MSRDWVGRIPVLLGLFGFGVSVAACGGPGMNAAHASASKGSSRPSASASPGMSSTTLSRPGARSGGSVAGFDLQQLSSITNYAFTSSVVDEPTRVTQIEGRVHSPTDWMATVTGIPLNGVVFYDIDGEGREEKGGHVSPVAFRSPDGASHLQGEGYYARVLLYDVEQMGLRLMPDRGCEVAGVSGRNYDLGHPPGSSFIEQGSVCLADGSGALLIYFLRRPTSASSGTNGVTISSFSITQVGGVGTISSPA